VHISNSDCSTQYQRKKQEPQKTENTCQIDHSLHRLLTCNSAPQIIVLHCL